MSAADGRLTIRSYRTVFRFERRLYRFDRWRLPVRGGVPLRVLFYLPAVYLALAVVGRLPVLGWALAVLPDPLRWGLLPLALVLALLRVELDGRPAHRALWAIVRWRLGARWRAGLRACSPPGPAPLASGALVVRPDWRAGGARTGRVFGAARVRLRCATRVRRPGQGDAGEARVSARRLVLDVEAGTTSSAGRVVEIPAGGVLELR